METQQTHRELFFILLEEKNQRQQCEFPQEYVIKDLGLQEHSQEELKEVRKTIYRFCSTVFQKWKSSRRILGGFLLHNLEWLDKNYLCQCHLYHALPKVDRKRPSLNQAKEEKDRKQKVYAKLLLLKNCLLLLR